VKTSRRALPHNVAIKHMFTSYRMDDLIRILSAATGASGWATPCAESRARSGHVRRGEAGWLRPANIAAASLRRPRAAVSIRWPIVGV
jgi:hypothetical protein